MYLGWQGDAELVAMALFCGYGSISPGCVNVQPLDPVSRVLRNTKELVDKFPVRLRGLQCLRTAVSSLISLPGLGDFQHQSCLADPPEHHACCPLERGLLS